jgi:dimethylamine monooxygenase subunit A
VSDYVYGPPTDGKPFKLAMGLRTLEASLWLEGGSDLAAQLKERSSLISQAESVVYGHVDGHDAEIQYFSKLLMRNLKEFHATEYSFTSNSVTHRETGFQADLSSAKLLLELTRVVAEDLCILKKIDGSWTLIAGAVLFPSRWKLSEKIGKSLDEIHSPVPGYGTALQPYMTATFDKITTERPVWRKNWSLHSTPDLHQPESIHDECDPLEYWWRTERQTLTRSSESESILFTIRNRAEPLAWIMGRPDEAAAFAETLNSMSPETIEYKGLAGAHQEIVRALMLAP